MDSKMLDFLIAPGRDPTLGDHVMEFGRLVGSWLLEATFIDDDGTESHTSGEWHFEWILGGRAIQDVLIFPAVGSKGGLTPAHKIGTSLRFYDPDASTWRVVWINPASGTMYKLSGGADGDRIVLDGDSHDGEPTQWVFEDLTESSFLWRGYVSDDDGASWRLIQEMRATRQTP